MTISCNFATEMVSSTKIPNEFTFPDWLEVDKEWFAGEVKQLIREFESGFEELGIELQERTYAVYAIHHTHTRPYEDDGDWYERTVHQVYSVDLCSIDCLSPGPGTRVGTVVIKAPAVPVRDLSHGTKEATC